MTVGNPTRPTVVVGVDGSEPNRAAVEYAAAEAAAYDRPLLLLGAMDYGGAMLEGAGTVTDHEWELLNELRDRAAVEHPGLRAKTLVRFGHAVPSLLNSTGDRDLLVVGKRGLGAVRRMLVGSTSIRVAARSRVPVVVVPAEWDAAAAGPVVVGITPDQPYEPVLRFAFRRARRDGAALRVVHAIDLRKVLTWDPALAMPIWYHWEEHSVTQLERSVKQFRDEFPDVDVEVVRDRGHAADVVLDHGRDARLIVLGRRHHGPATWGLGSVAREVLHDAEVPVAVVPAG